jgi:hypothetical protein
MSSKRKTKNAGPRPVHEDELKNGLVVLVEPRKGESGGLVPATALFPSKKMAKSWAVKFHSDGKVFPRAVKAIKIEVEPQPAVMGPALKKPKSKNPSQKEKTQVEMGPVMKKTLLAPASDASADDDDNNIEMGDGDGGAAGGGTDGGAGEWDGGISSEGPGHEILSNPEKDFHSLQRARLMLEWLIFPITVEEFYR